MTAFRASVRLLVWIQERTLLLVPTLAYLCRLGCVVALLLDPLRELVRVHRQLCLQRLGDG